MHDDLTYLDDVVDVDVLVVEIDLVSAFAFYLVAIFGQVDVALNEDGTGADPLFSAFVVLSFGTTAEVKCLVGELVC